MTARALGLVVKARAQAAVAPVLARVNALPPRDRGALLACSVAVLVAAELLVIVPMGDKRRAMLNAEVQQSQSASEEQARETAQREETLINLQERVTTLTRELAARGLGQARGHSLSELLDRALQGQNVRLMSLRNLDTQALAAQSAAPAVAASAGVPGADAAAPGVAAGASATPSAALYRHRYELVLQGDMPALVAAAQTLESRLSPARIERVRLATEADQQLQLVMVFGAIGTERTWLNL